MTELSTGKDRLSCAEVTLLFNGEVSDFHSVEEHEAISRHLSACPRCSEFVKLASNLKRFPQNLSNEELDFAIHRVKNKARQHKTPFQPRIRRWVVVGAAAAAVAALTVLGVFRSDLFPPMPTEPQVVFQCTPSAPIEPVTGVFLTYCSGDKAPKAAVDADGDVKVSLQSGAVGLFVDPHRPEKRRVVVETPKGAVRVKGTVFTVRIEREQTWVEVFRGVVEILSSSEESIVLDVPAGHGAEIMSGRTFALSTPKTEILRAQLGAAVHESSPVAGESHGMQNALTSNESTDGEAVETSLTSVPAGDAGPVGLSARHGAAGLPRHSADAMYDLIQAAQACLIDRDWACAAARYRTVLERYARRPESLAVLISLAKVELRYLGAPGEALTHYKKYQRRAPSGPLAEEALFGIAEAFQRLGRTAEEKQALGRFLEKFPGSSLAPKARARLKQIGL